MDNHVPLCRMIVELNNKRDVSKTIEMSGPAVKWLANNGNKNDS